MKNESQPKWIKNIMRMFEPDWMKKWSTQKELTPVLAEVNRLPEKKLIRAALEARTSEVRLAAVQNPRLMDQRTLEQIVDHMPREMEKANDDDAQMLTTIAKKLCEAGSQSAALALVKAINAYADNASDYMGHECGPQDYHYEMPRLIELLKKHYKKGTGATQLKQRDWHIDHGDPKCDTHEDHVIGIDFM